MSKKNSVKRAFIIRYGNELGLKKYLEICKSYGLTKDQYIKKHGIKKWKILREQKKSYGLVASIKKYGKEEGTQRWKRTLNKKLKTQKKNHVNVSYRNGRTLNEYQIRHGITKGYNLWSLRNQRQSYRFSEQYYIDTYGNDDGKIKWEEYKHNQNKNSLDKFIKRHGKKNGIILYNKFRESVKITEQKMILKYGDALGKEKYKNWLFGISNNCTLFARGYSKISQKLFWEIYSCLPIELQKKCYFAELNQEYQIYINKFDCKIICVDFKCNNKIIEFDGTYWHERPETKNKDVIKENYIKSFGYKIYRISDVDYKINPEKTIQQCVAFIIGN